MIQGGTWTEEESPCRAKTKPRELRTSGWTAVLFTHWVRAGERQWPHRLQVSALFLHCLSICEYHILFLSCTVLFETLANPTQGIQLKAGWDEVLWFLLETFSDSPLATAVEKKKLQWQGGGFYWKIFFLSFRMAKIVYLQTKVTSI